MKKNITFICCMLLIFMMAAAASASESGELNIQDYSTISIEAADIEVSDETVIPERVISFIPFSH